MTLLSTSPAHPATLVERLGADPLTGGLRRSLVALARTARAQVGTTDGAGVSVLLGSGPAYAGSDSRAEAVEKVQHTLGEGPGLDALAAGRVVRWSAVGADEGRWPRFVARVRGLGVQGVVAVPLLVDGEPLGELTLCYPTAERVDLTGDADLHGATTTALQTLLDVRLRALVVESWRALETARLDRAEVDLAVGLLSDRYGFTVNQALVLVVQLARQDGVGAAAAARALTGPSVAP